MKPEGLHVIIWREITTKKSNRNDFVTHFTAFYAISVVQTVLLSAWSPDISFWAIFSGIIGCLEVLGKEFYDYLGNSSKFEWSDVLGGWLAIFLSILTCYSFMLTIV